MDEQDQEALGILFELFRGMRGRDVDILVKAFGLDILWSDAIAERELALAVWRTMKAAKRKENEAS